MVGDYGFKCDQSLVDLIDLDVTLAQFCCATCTKMGKSKKEAQTCGSLKYKGDGNCDDENNNKGCEYDGGDCCYKSVEGGVVKKDYCEEVSFKQLRSSLLD